MKRATFTAVGVGLLAMGGALRGAGAQALPPLLQNGTIDMECGSTTNSVERQKQVSFGPTYFVINVSAAVKKSSGIKTFADLNGKAVASTSGTTSIPLLRGYEKAKGIEKMRNGERNVVISFADLAASGASAGAAGAWRPPSRSAWVPTPGSPWATTTSTLTTSRTTASR